MAKFCQDTATLNKAAAPVGSPDTPAKSARLLRVFSANQLTVDDLLKVAPSAIKADAKLLADTINAAIKADSLEGLSQAAGVGQRVAAFCSQNMDGTPK